MKKLLISILAVAISFLVIDRIGGCIMNIAFQHSKSVLAPKLCHLAYDAHEDVILLGTSRCNCHYVPTIIADSLKMTVYNGGIDGSKNIYSHYIALCYALACHKPKVVCLEVMEEDSRQTDDPFEPISRFAPFFGMNSRADSLYAIAGVAWKYQLSHLYRHNATSLTTITGLIQAAKESDEKGFYSLKNESGIASSLRLEEEPEPREVDSLKLACLQRFMDLCNENRVKLVLVASPKYTIARDAQYGEMKSLAKKNGIPFLDYHSQGLYHDHPEYFKDIAHLLDEGARLYSSVFASDLKTHIADTLAAMWVE